MTGPIKHSHGATKPAATAYDPTRFHRARDLYPERVNPLLKAAGIRDMQAFLNGLQSFMRTVPELQQLAKAADAHGCEGVLSGGSALRVMLAYVDSLNPQTAPKDKRLHALMEGSDVDALLLRPSGESLSNTEVAAVATELNAASGASLVAPLPSKERRYYAVEWDLQDGREFYELNQTFGGESLAHVGLGLDTSGELVVYDPDGALRHFFEGYFDYGFGKDPEHHPMVLNGMSDPTLDALRVIRMVGTVGGHGVRPSEQALDALDAMGEDATRRKWQIQAGFVHSPEQKLERKWKKYLEKVWIDHRDPAQARALLDRSGFSEVLTYLGLRNMLESPLAEERPVTPASDFPQVHEWARANELELLSAVARPADPLYLWTSKNRAGALEDGSVPFQSDAGPLGAGLYLGDKAFPDKGTASVLLQARLSPDARLFDLRTPGARELLDSYLQEFTTDFLPSKLNEGGRQAQPLISNDIVTGTKDESVPDFMNVDPSPQLDAERDARSFALTHLASVLGVDGFIDGHGTSIRAVVTNRAALDGFTRQYDFQNGIMEQLRAGTLGKRTEHGVRALLALNGQAGVDEIISLMNDGKLTLSQLFPAEPVGTTGSRRTSLFEDLPFVDTRLAQALLKHLAREGQGLSDDQRFSVLAAVGHLRGELPNDGSVSASA